MWPAVPGCSLHLQAQQRPQEQLVRAAAKRETVQQKEQVLMESGGNTGGVALLLVFIEMNKGGKTNPALLR